MHSGAVHWPEWCYKLPDVIWSRYQRQPWPVVVVVTRWTGRQLPSSRVPSRRCLSSRLSCPCIQTNSQDNLHPTTTCQLQDPGIRQPLDFRSSLCHPRLGPSDRLDDRGRSRPRCRLTKPQASRRQGLTLHGRHTARSTTPSSSHHPTTPHPGSQHVAVFASDPHQHAATALATRHPLRGTVSRPRLPSPLIHLAPR